MTRPRVSGAGGARVRGPSGRGEASDRAREEWGKVVVTGWKGGDDEAEKVGAVGSDSRPPL